MTYGKAGWHVQAHASEPREPTPLARRLGSTIFSFRDDRHQYLTHTASTSDALHIIGCDRCIRQQAPKIGASSGFRALFGFSQLGLGSALPDLIGNGH